MSYRSYVDGFMKWLIDSKPKGPKAKVAKPQAATSDGDPRPNAPVSFWPSVNAGGGTGGPGCVFKHDPSP